MPIPIEAVLFVFLLFAAVIIARLKDLFAAAMLTSMFSLLSAGLFTLMDAVDVAFTEAAVGAGVSTVFILGTISLTTRKEKRQKLRLAPLLAVGLMGFALLYGTLDMPAYGDADSPANQHLAKQFIELEEGALRAAEGHEDGHDAPKRVGLPNMVTSILASYRGYDTLGETGVIFTATLGVWLLLRNRRREADDDGEAAGDDA